MKKTAVFLLLLVCFTLFYGCKKTEDGSYVAPIVISEKINGVWALTSIKQVDEIAKANGEATTEMVLTDQFNFASFSITFQVDANQLPNIYSVSGTAPGLLSPTGFWDMDYAYPHTDGTASKINLYSDATKLAKTATLDILTIPGEKKVLQFTMIRKINGVPFVSYTYQLSIQN